MNIWFYWSELNPWSYFYIVLKKPDNFTVLNKVLLVLGRRNCAHRENCCFSLLLWILSCSIVLLFCIIYLYIIHKEFYLHSLQTMNSTVHYNLFSSNLKENHMRYKSINNLWNISGSTINREFFFEKMCVLKKKYYSFSVFVIVVKYQPSFLSQDIVGN